MKALLAALAACFAVKRAMQYETRTWCDSKVYVHFSDSFSEALEWARCYGDGWGMSTIWHGGEFVAAVNPEAS